ncbi:WD repeat-containing protein 35-like [Corticium candelabrum]|uniref:WD repeat-containing protein 35-like n=1 Tax=Corticium candelabrum TaxID=121492 RepID=UPI002E262B77|nr:WD repeat-containing protein 35-like [Corticium candelabrum]
MVTALRLRNYEDILNPVDIYSLLALTCCMSRSFAICSKALVKLESLDEVLDEDKQEYEALALEIFTRHSPKDRSSTDQLISWELASDVEDGETKLPVCIVTGRPIIDYQFWMCGTCKHRAYEGEIEAYNYCPLCHSSM